MLSDTKLEERIEKLISELSLPKTKEVQVGSHTEYVSWDWRDNTTEEVPEYATVPDLENITKIEAAQNGLIEIGRPVIKYVVDSFIPDLSVLVGIGKKDKEAPREISDKLADKVELYKPGTYGNSGAIETLLKFSMAIHSLDVANGLIRGLQNTSNDKYKAGLGCLAAIDKSKSKELADYIYQREFNTGRLTYSTLEAIAASNLKDWQFEDLPSIIKSLSIRDFPKHITDSKVAQIFKQVYNHGIKPEVVDLVISSLEENPSYEKEQLLIPVLALIPNDKAVDFLIENKRYDPPAQYYYGHEYSKFNLIRIATDEGSKKAARYLLEHSKFCTDIYKGSRQLGRGKFRSFISAVFKLRF